MLLRAALILVTASVAMARELARLTPQDIDKRSPKAGGGFALVVGPGNTCPSGTTQCNGWDCCPNSLTSDGGAGIAAACCPACKWPVSTVAFHIVQ
jgi:hypothetical protein